jgi:superfamily II DNA/RNA helicase
MPTEATLEIAQNIRAELASASLTPQQARLYSQSVRLDLGQAGLATYQREEALTLLDQALLLIESALLERSADPALPWTNGIKRAGEILEWLAQKDLLESLNPKLNEKETQESPAIAPIPVHLLAAAAYQLAGYPALASGLLQKAPKNDNTSMLLLSLFRADFPKALASIRTYWSRNKRLSPTDDSDISALAMQHVIMCLGTVCAHFRTGEKGLTERALKKLANLSRIFVYSRDPFSGLLATLAYEICCRYVETCIWPVIEKLQLSSSAKASKAFIQFARAGFVNRRALIWPAQRLGISRLTSEGSFVLCTPTGSGKTTVATIATIQSLFIDFDEDDIFADPQPENIVLYMVPSKALAAEVENRLAQDMRFITPEPVIITGLYGGTDWGPTDAWIERNRATVLVCTYEKGDALIRHLGSLFLNRVKLILIDEAHMIDKKRESLNALSRGESRPFRLEQLGTRLLVAQEIFGFRIIALSAVAAYAAPAMARWISKDSSALPLKSDHRSTRQMVGRLLITHQGRFRIHYDLMNNKSLQFNTDNPNESPYLETPFPNIPEWPHRNGGPEKSLYAPTLWAALNLAVERTDRVAPTVLISITQNINSFARNCLLILQGWESSTLPNYRNINEQDPCWIRCLAAAADYFSDKSVEYQLLTKGIAVHHGKMPALLSRRLKEVIDQGFIRVVIATSTLSEGVNIPVNYVLIPSVYRGNTRFSMQEFTNLIGRAGRPGNGTEGHSLVILHDGPGYNRQFNGYQELYAEILESSSITSSMDSSDSASSPLQQLLQAIQSNWTRLSAIDSDLVFQDWIEQTTVVKQEIEDGTPSALLDSLDGFIIAALQEVENLNSSQISDSEMEENLSRIWKCTYAYAAKVQEEALNQIWLVRGKSLYQRYPEAEIRRHIYKTSLTPRSALSLLANIPILKTQLESGVNYADFSPQDRFHFIIETLSLLSKVPAFSISQSLGKKKNFGDWPLILSWWLMRDSEPSAKEIPEWYDYVADNFIYRANWGFGSVLGIILETASGDADTLNLELWSKSGLPWIAFWLKELLTWGTLDPLVSFLLARGNAIDRPDAELTAKEYYNQLPDDMDANEKLDPRRMRVWLEGRQSPKSRSERKQYTMPIKLTNALETYINKKLYVLPIMAENSLIWIDPAGYEVATSVIPKEWPNNPDRFDFELSVEHGIVNGQSYLLHADNEP